MKKSLGFLLVFTTAMHSSDSDGSLWNSVKKQIVSTGKSVGSTAFKGANALLHNPTTLVMAGVTGYFLKNTTASTYSASYHDNDYSFDTHISVIPAVVTAAGVSISSLITFDNWMKLRAEWITLKQKNATANKLHLRNVWYAPSGEVLKDASDIITAFNAVKTDGKKLMRLYFIKQAGVVDERAALRSIDDALKKLADSLSQYTYFTNIHYVLARACNLCTPEELLTSDILLDPAVTDVLLEAYEHATGFAVYSTRMAWSDSLKISVPAIYTWNYNMASACVWELLQQYGRLKAVRKVIEHVALEDNMQNYGIYLKS